MINVDINKVDERDYDYRWNFLLSPLGINIYDTLYKFGNEEIEMERETIRIQEIRIYSGGVSRNKVLRTVKMLEKYGFIEVKRHRGKRPNQYILYPIPEFRDIFADEFNKKKNKFEHKVYKKGNTDTSFAKKGKSIKKRDKKERQRKAKITKTVKKWYNEFYEKWYNSSYDPSDTKNFNKQCYALYERFEKEFGGKVSKMIRGYIRWSFFNYEEYASYIDILYPGHLTSDALFGNWTKQLSNEKLKEKKKPDKSKKKKKKKRKTYYKEKEGLDEYYIRGILFMQYDVADIRGHNTLYGTNSKKVRWKVLNKLIQYNIIEQEGEVWWSELPQKLLDEIHNLLGYDKIDKSKKDVGYGILGKNLTGHKLEREL